MLILTLSGDAVIDENLKLMLPIVYILHQWARVWLFYATLEHFLSPWIAH